MSKFEESPPGFVLQSIVCITGDNEYRRLEHCVSLLLPVVSAAKLASDHRAALTERIEQLNSKDSSTEPDEAEPSHNPLGGSKNSKGPFAPVLSAQDRTERENEKKRAEAESRRTSLADLRAKQSRSKSTRSKWVEVYKWDEPLKLLEGSTKTADRDYIARAKGIFDDLAARGNFRALAQTDDQSLKKLASTNPIYSDVVEFVLQQITICRLAKKPIRIPPILLLGEAGVGKTHFSNSLAKALHTDIHRVSFDGNVTSSTLLGSAAHWSNTTPGEITSSVLFGTKANPVFLLDEIDKAGRGGGYQDPRASLHSLLEPVSSSQVTDISLNVQFDASYITFIATANEALFVPGTLRSRFTEFRISKPSGEAALKMASVMTKATHVKMKLPGFKEPNYELAKLVAHLTPREQRQELERAYAIAVSAGRNALLREDFSADVLLDDSSPTPGTARRWIH